jgi:hypothetical protein
VSGRKPTEAIRGQSRHGWNWEWSRKRRVVYKGLEDVHLIEQDSRLPQRRRDFSNKAKKEGILRGVISMLTFLLTHVVRAMKAVYFLSSGRRSFQVLLMHRADFVPSVLIPVVFHLTDLSRAAPSVAINKSHMSGAA